MTGQQKVSALEEVGGMKHDPKKKRHSKGNGKGFATVQLSKREFFGKTKSDRKKAPSGKENQSTCFAFKKRRLSKKEQPAITGIHLCVPFIKKEVADLGKKCAFKYTQQDGGDPMN